MQLRPDAKTIQKRSGVRLGLPAVHLCEFALELTGADAVLIGEVLLGVDRFLFLHNIIQSLVAHNDRIENRELIIFKMVLLQHGETLARCDDDVAVCRLELSGENLQKRRLSGAVRTDDTIAVALGKFDVYIFK